jgi:galactose mutarotase-like enzyme
MQRLLIQNRKGSIAAEVLPDYGGMVGKLVINGRDVLCLDESRVADSPVSAGGIPVLFPFAGSVKNDRYTIKGTEYHMPKHGVVKNRTFAIKDQSENRVTLWVKGDEALQSRNYPYLFTLELLYRIIQDTLEITAQIENRSPEPMPHTLGWHPYFKASNRAMLEFSHSMAVQYDYVRGIDGPAPATIRLDQDLDDVYCMPTSNEYTLVNAPDGYAVRCVMDNAFQSIVVYTGKPGCVCIEPWCGVPDSINSGRLVQWVPPGDSREYKVRLTLKAL